ncbi:MAG: hypothetical protein ACREYC_20890, partial [Gammaproteobacteria bacterium]
TQHTVEQPTSSEFPAVDTHLCAEFRQSPSQKGKHKELAQAAYHRKLLDQLIGSVTGGWDRTANLGVMKAPLVLCIE